MSSKQRTRLAPTSSLHSSVQSREELENDIDAPPLEPDAVSTTTSMVSTSMTTTAPGGASVASASMTSAATDSGKPKKPKKKKVKKKKKVPPAEGASSTLVNGSVASAAAAALDEPKKSSHSGRRSTEKKTTRTRGPSRRVSEGENDQDDDDDLESTPGAYSLRPTTDPTPQEDENVQIMERYSSTRDTSAAPNQMHDSFHNNPSGDVLVSAHVVDDEADLETRLRREFQQKLESITQQQAIPAKGVQVAQVDPNVPVLAAETDKSPTAEGSSRRQMYCIAIAVLVLVGAAVGITIVVTSDNDESPAGLFEPTSAPNQEPDGETVEWLIEQVEDLSEPGIFEDHDSDQYQAVQRLTQDDNYLLSDGPSDRQLRERYIVTLFAVATGSASWNRGHNFFDSPNHCEWNNGNGKGVFCDENNFVSKLRFQDNNLQGYLISEIGHLSDLSELILAHERELGGVIPSEIGMLQDLQVLSFINNAMVGVVPDELAHLSSLEILEISATALEGEIPQFDGSSLQEIALSDNMGLYGDLFNMFLTLPTTLTSFDCEGCDFRDTNVHDIEWSRYADLVKLQLEDTGVGGSIPDSLASHSNMEELNLGENALTGEIPSALAESGEMERLELHGNQLVGSIPLFQSAKIKRLNLSGNQVLEGNIGEVLSSLPRTIKAIVLGENQLTGSIPNNIGSYANLEHLHLSFNLLTGGIPNSMGDMERLEELHLEGNNLEGTIPDGLVAGSNLNELALHDNALEDNLNDVFCPNGLEWLTVDCGEPVLVECECCDCYSHDLGDFE